MPRALRRALRRGVPRNEIAPRVRSGAPTHNAHAGRRLRNHACEIYTTTIYSCIDYTAYYPCAVTSALRTLRGVSTLYKAVGQVFSLLSGFL